MKLPSFSHALSELFTGLKRKSLGSGGGGGEQHEASPAKRSRQATAMTPAGAGGDASMAEAGPSRAAPHTATASTRATTTPPCPDTDEQQFRQVLHALDRVELHTAQRNNGNANSGSNTHGGGRAAAQLQDSPVGEQTFSFAQTLDATQQQLQHIRFTPLGKGSPGGGGGLHQQPSWGSRRKGFGTRTPAGGGSGSSSAGGQQQQQRKYTASPYGQAAPAGQQQQQPQGAPSHLAAAAAGGAGARRGPPVGLFGRQQQQQQPSLGGRGPPAAGRGWLPLPPQVQQPLSAAAVAAAAALPLPGGAGDDGLLVTKRLSFDGLSEVAPSPGGGWGMGLAGVGAITPPPVFAAELRHASRMMAAQQPSAEEAALEARAADARARLDRQQRQAKQLHESNDQVRAQIHRTQARPAGYGGPSPAAAAALLKQEQQQVIADQARLLQQQGELQQAQLQRRQRAAAWQSAAADAVAAQQQQQQQQPTPAREPWRHWLDGRKQEQQREAEALQQPEPEEEQQLGGDEDSDVVELLDDDEEGEEEEQEEGGHFLQGAAEASASESSVEESEQDAASAEDAAAALQGLGITVWIGARSNWQPSQEQLARFHAATSGGGNLGEVLATHKRSNQSLTRGDLSTMQQGEWLNDECMNMYVALMQDRDLALRQSGGLRCHFFNTFFLNKLYRDSGYKYSEVRRWTLPKRLQAVGLPGESVLKCERILLPVHQGNHWTALMVDLVARRLVFFDSLGGKNRAAVEAVKRWVADEAQDKLAEAWDTASWAEEYPTAIPRQTNGCDCGVFALLFINRLAVRRCAFDFEQADLVLAARAAITADLLDGALHSTRAHHHHQQHAAAAAPAAAAANSGAD